MDPGVVPTPYVLRDRNRTRPRCRKKQTRVSHRTPAWPSRGCRWDASARRVLAPVGCARAIVLFLLPGPGSPVLLNRSGTWSVKSCRCARRAWNVPNRVARAKPGSRGLGNCRATQRQNPPRRHQSESILPPLRTGSLPAGRVILW